MQPDACHCPLMFSTIQSVYCSAPLHPGGVTLGQTFCFVNSTCAPVGIRASRVSVAVAGQLATSDGELWMMARLRLIPSPGAGAVGVGTGLGVGTGKGAAGVRNVWVADHG